MPLPAASLRFTLGSMVVRMASVAVLLGACGSSETGTRATADVAGGAAGAFPGGAGGASASRAADSAAGGGGAGGRGGASGSAGSQLSPDERAALAHELWDSLHADETNEDREAAWEAEIKRRLDAYDRGDVTAVPGAEAFATLRARARGSVP
jgi:putative addiction module component (TIGR02574 family)